MLLPFFKKDVFLKDATNRSIKSNIQEYIKCQVKLNELSRYENLKHLNVTSCDMVPDEVLFIFKIAFPYLKVVNYYGENIDLWDIRHE